MRGASEGLGAPPRLLLTLGLVAALSLARCAARPAVLPDPAPGAGSAVDSTVDSSPAISEMSAPLPAQHSDYPPSQFLLATGRGDLSRGIAICTKTADMAARAELAKLIAVSVRERSRDRVRDRSGRAVDQDIEIVREEEASEHLQDVRIVHRNVDPRTGTCTSTAAMPKQATIPEIPR